MKPFLAILALAAVLSPAAARGMPRSLLELRPLPAVCNATAPEPITLVRGIVSSSRAIVFLKTRSASCVRARCRSVSPTAADVYVGVWSSPHIPVDQAEAYPEVKAGTSYVCDFEDVSGDLVGPTFTYAFETPPYGEKGRKIGSTTAEITFTSDTAGVRGFDGARCTGGGETVVVNFGMTYAAMEYVISATGLKPGTAYACIASGHRGKYEGSWSETFEFTTLPSPPSPKPKPSPVPVPKPAKPVLRSVKTTKNGAVVTTTKPARATSFRASCRVKGTAKRVTSSVAVSKTSVFATLKNLRPGTTYVCDILGANKSGAGPALAATLRTKK